MGMETINLVLDSALLKEYDTFYFSKHKKAKKSPIEQPRHPSINVWSIMPRIQANDLKQKWLDFGIWWMNKLGLSDCKYEQVEMVFTTYMPTKRRADPDNTVPKYILDSFVASGLIVDDDYTHIRSLTLQVCYDKENPRTEIELKVIA